MLTRIKPPRRHYLWVKIPNICKFLLKVRGGKLPSPKNLTVDIFFCNNHTIGIDLKYDHKMGVIVYSKYITDTNLGYIMVFFAGKSPNAAHCRPYINNKIIITQLRSNVKRVFIKKSANTQKRLTKARSCVIMKIHSPLTAFCRLGRRRKSGAADCAPSRFSVLSRCDAGVPFAVPARFGLMRLAE